MKISEKTCIEFVNVLASKSAVPGGGGAAALVGAIGMALGSMVCNLTIGKKKYAEYEESVNEILVKAREIEKKLLSMIEKEEKNDENVISYTLRDHANGDAWREIKVIFNGNPKAVDVKVPKGNWTVIAEDGRINADGLGTSRGGKLSVAPTSALILAR